MARPASTPAVGYLLPGGGGRSRPPVAEGHGDALGRLFDALGRHTPTLEPDLPDGCWLDLRVGGRRPPAPADLAVAALATAREWGYPGARLGVAPTPGVARLAARHGPASPTVLDPAAVPAFLAPLPVACLGLDEAAAGQLALGRSRRCRAGRWATTSARSGWRSRRWRGARTIARWCPPAPPWC